MENNGTNPNEVHVVSTRRIKLVSPVPVFDATVPKYHNFALGAGVYVHNTVKKARFPYQGVLPLKGKIFNCFSGDTLVKRADGSTARIDSLDGEWEGLGYNGQASNDKMSASFVRKHVSELLVLTMDDGSVVRCTPDHEFLTDRGYVQAQHLTEEHELITASV